MFLNHIRSTITYIFLDLFMSQNITILCSKYFFVVARKETAREKQLKEEEKILESVAEKKGVCQSI